jgi:hypothetical protein
MEHKMTDETNNKQLDVVQPRQSFPLTPIPAAVGTVLNPPRSPLQGKFALQWQRALQLIRNRNRAAQANGGKRVPLT